jgi:hypothetical protein
LGKSRSKISGEEGPAWPQERGAHPYIHTDRLGNPQMTAEKPLGDQGELRNSNKYSDSKKARALTVIAMCEGNLTTASERMGIGIPTLSRWWNANAKKNSRTG